MLVCMREDAEVRLEPLVHCLSGDVSLGKQIISDFESFLTWRFVLVRKSMW
jgi:hypothetical protein